MMMSSSRRALILPVVLMVLILLALLGAMFAFRISADLASTQAMSLKFQTRLAAEAGVERVKLMLRDGRFDMDQWYDNPDSLHRIIVWTEGGSQAVWGSNDEFKEPRLTYRFSIVADDPTDDENRIRLGITDESSKLNLNTATKRQLLILVRAAVEDDVQTDPQDIVDAILDWRDPDHESRSEDEDTEGRYYRSLDPPYRVKNGPFDTVEELLLVKGVTARILYGEDYDRNGLLSANEDDGDDTFPPDNQDGVLNRGLYPYLTVLSKENNVSNDNRPRVNLLGDVNVLRKELEAMFPDEPQVVDFIVNVSRSSGNAANAGNGNRNNNTGNGRDDRNSRNRQADGDTDNDNRSEDETNADNEAPDTGNDGRAADSTDGEPPDTNETDDGENRQAPIRSPASLWRDWSVGDAAENYRGGSTPVTLKHLPILLDRTTTLPPEQRELVGLININTAPPLVLRCLDGLTEEQIRSIVEMRGRVDSEAKKTAAWLVEQEVVDLDTFVRIFPQITTRGQQFTIESLGYADHVGMVTRLQVVVDLLGPIAQTVYARDLSYLGGHYPIREEDLESIRGR